MAEAHRWQALAIHAARGVSPRNGTIRDPRRVNHHEQITSTGIGKARHRPQVGSRIAGSLTDQHLGYSSRLGMS